MSKKIIGILLVICLIMGLLPVVALADEPKTAKIRIVSFTVVTLTEGGDPVYYKNSEYDLYNADGVLQTAKGYNQVLGDENNWNVKFEYPAGGVVTVTLKDAKIANAIGGKAAYKKSTNAETGAVEYKSTGNIGAFLPDSSSPMDVKFILTGSNMIDCNYGVVRGTVNASQYFKNITIEGEPGNKLVANGGAQGIVTDYSISLKNANIEIANSGAGGTRVPILAGKDITIEGGHIKASNDKNVAIQAKEGNITINGDVTTHHTLTSTAEAAGIDAPKGEITINGGNLNLTSTNACGLRAPTITINGGDIKITTPYKGVWAKDADGSCIILGGTIEITALNAFNKAPTLGAGVDGLAGLDEEDADYYEDTKYTKPWVKLGKGVAPSVTTSTTVPSTTSTTVPPTTSATAATTGSTTAATTKATTAATTAATTKATTAATKAPTVPTKATEGNAADSGDNSLVIIAVAVAVAAVLAAVAVVIIKKKKAA